MEGDCEAQKDNNKHDGDVVLSEPIEKEEFDAEFTLDYESGELEELHSFIKLAQIIKILVCYIITLLFEGLVLLLFRYPLIRKNKKHFIIINTITQIFLNIVIAISRGGWVLLLNLIIAEAIIILTESIYYMFTLESKDGRIKKGKNIAYGFTANIVSIIFGGITSLVLMAI